jgi:hypothetical protein
VISNVFAGYNVFKYNTIIPFYYTRTHTHTQAYKYRRLLNFNYYMLIFYWGIELSEHIECAFKDHICEFCKTNQIDIQIEEC